MKLIKSIVLASALLTSTITSALSINDAAGVRLEIERTLLDGSVQVIVQEFPDIYLAIAWMTNREETKGCDPFVTKLTITPIPY